MHPNTSRDILRCVEMSRDVSTPGFWLVRRQHGCHSRQLTTSRHVSRYPGISRDMSTLVPRHFSAHLEMCRDVLRCLETLLNISPWNTQRQDCERQRRRDVARHLEMSRDVAGPILLRIATSRHVVRCSEIWQHVARRVKMGFDH